MHVDLLLAYDVLHLVQDLRNGCEDRLTDEFELLSLHVVVNIAVLHEALDIEVMFGVAGQDFSLLFDVLHHLEDCLLALSDVAPARSFLKDSSVELKEVVVDVPAADVPAVLLLQDVHLPIGETAQEHAELGVSEVNEEHVSGCGGVQLVLPEDSVVKGNCSRLVEQSGDS